MRVVILLVGLYCLQNTNFASDSWWESRAFPVLDFFFLTYLVIDLMLFFFMLQQGDSLRARDYAEDNLWHMIYEKALRRVDQQANFAGLWYWLGVSLEVGLMLMAFMHAGGLLIDVLLHTGI